VSVSAVPMSLRSWMSAVTEIARAVNAAEPLEEVLNRVAVQACELIGFELCAVMLADEQRLPRGPHDRGPRRPANATRTMPGLERRSGSRQAASL
jgi:hypothetical protein